MGGGSLSAAGWRRWFESEDAAEHSRPPLRQDFGESAEYGCAAAQAGTAEPSAVP
jgi:hypothetical protein